MSVQQCPFSPLPTVCSDIPGISFRTTTAKKCWSGRAMFVVMLRVMRCIEFLIREEFQSVSSLVDSR